MQFANSIRTQTRRALSLAGFAGFLALWELSVRLHWLPAALIPAPSSLLDSFPREWANGAWPHSVLSSLRHYSLGVGIGGVLGLLLGVAAGTWPVFDAIQEGIARLLRPIPPLAWIPFAIVWFGITTAAATFIIALGVFWPVYFSTHAAVKAVDPSWLELARAFGQHGLRNRLGKFVLPAAAPGIVGGLRTGVGMGWIVVLAAELFGVPGIGQRMTEASGVLATDLVVLYMVTIAGLYTVFDMAVVQLGRSVTRWMH